MSDFATVWDDAGASAEQASADKAMAMAKQASAGIKDFLFQASDEADFGHRIAMAEDDLMTAAAAGGISVHALVAEQTREFDLLMEAKRTVATKPYTDPSTGEFVGEHETRNNEGEVSRTTEWFDHEGDAKDYGKNGPAKTAGKPQVCPDCNGARAVPAQGHESYHEVSNGHVRCPSCAGHGVVAGGSGDDIPDYGQDGRSGLHSDYDKNDFHPGYSASLKQAEASLANLRTALQEGQDPLEWLEEQAQGEGQAEKPSEAGIEATQGKRTKQAVPPFSREAASGYYDRENLSPGETDDLPKGTTHIDESGPHPRVHTFGSTGEAYNASQTHDAIKDGDVLHVPSEGVTGFLQDAWPIAVHHNGDPGEFHGTKPGQDVNDVFGGGPLGKQYGLKDYSETLAKAKAVHEGTHKQASDDDDDDEVTDGTWEQAARTRQRYLDKKAEGAMRPF